MTYVWKVHYWEYRVMGERNWNEANERTDIAFSEEGALKLDAHYRQLHYRIDPKPMKVPIQQLTLDELGWCLKIVGEEVGRWDTAKMDLDRVNWERETERLRELGRELFLEHDRRLNEITNRCEGCESDIPI